MESEASPESLGFCYVAGRLPLGAVTETLREISHLRDLPRSLMRKQEPMFEIGYRMRIAPVSPDKGMGVWLLEPIPKGAIVFEYAGEVVTEEDANFREARYAKQKDAGKRYILDLVSSQGKPVIIVDSTHFGNVSR